MGLPADDTYACKIFSSESDRPWPLFATAMAYWYYIAFLMLKVLCNGLVTIPLVARQRINSRTITTARFSRVEIVGDSIDEQTLPTKEIIKDFSTMNNIILFDGVCNFCNAWVDLLLRLDTEKKFKLCALQSENGMVRRFNP